jgi:hypothetical protein
MFTTLFGILLLDTIFENIRTDELIYPRKNDVSGQSIKGRLISESNENIFWYN